MKNINDVPMEGLLPALADLPSDYRKHIVDILGNHFFGWGLSPRTIDLTVEFERIKNTPYYRFHRYEENGTGIGMSRETTCKQFFGVPAKINLNKRNSNGPKSFLSVHNLGEKLAETVLSKNIPANLKGFEVLTKTEDDDDYLYCIRNTTTSEWVVEPKRVSYDEANNELRAIMDRIGDKGTYSSYVINTETLVKNQNDTTWYTKLIGYVENIFMGYLDATDTKHPIYNLNFSITDNDFITETTTLKPKKFVFEKTGSVPQNVGTVNIGGKGYTYSIGKRPIKGSDELKNFDLQNPDRRALVGKDLIENLARHAVIILKDKHTGYLYYVQKVPVGAKDWLERVVMIIDVEKNDLLTDALKSKAHIKDAKGNPVSVINLHRMLIQNVATPTYYQDGVTESSLRDQLLSVLKGETAYHPTLYKELVNELNIPVNGNLQDSYDYCKKYLQLEYPVEGIEKALDMINMDTNHVKELKIGEPDADDLNQILAYGFVQPNTTAITTLGISKGLDIPSSPTSGFNAVKLGKFSTDLNNHPQTKHIKWKLLDLRYFGLHKIIK